VDEALRNLAAVGADTSRAVLLDNFCWGDTEDPRQLGSLVRAALGCRDAALGYGVPFISGKDSLNNTFIDAAGRKISIPGTLLISAAAPVPNPSKRLTMDLKSPGHALYLVEPTAATFRASRKVLDCVFLAAHKGLIVSCHDLSEGGLAVAAAEMAFAGEVGLEIDVSPLLAHSPEFSSPSPAEVLFGEGLTRFLFEVRPEHILAIQKLLRPTRFFRIGKTTEDDLFRVRLKESLLVETPLAVLRAAWSETLPSLMEGAPVERTAVREVAEVV